MNEDLRTAYLNTSYQVPSMHLVLTISQTNPELDRILTGHQLHTWAFITAWNPFSRQLNPDENINRNLLLEIDLKPYTYYPGMGVGNDETWDPEPSFLVLGVPYDEAKALGNKYQQNAIVWGEKNQACQLVILVEDNSVTNI